MSPETLAILRGGNPALDIRPVGDTAFAAYGSVVEDEGIPALVAYLQQHTPVEEGSRYLASDAGAERLPIFESMGRRIFGGQDIQIGWCNGTGRVLNALEYHAGVEVNVAAADAVLLLARKADMVDGKLDTSAVRGFYLQTGQAVVLESTTLHFAPCAVDAAGFRMGVLLTRGTNAPLKNRSPADAPLWMANKWLLTHPEATQLVEAGAYVGLRGPRIALRGET